MAVTVNWTDEFEAWMDTLTHREHREVIHAIEMLRELGLQLGHPYSSAIKGSRFPLRELRPKRGDSPLRPIYAFDPNRDALLLIGGDKDADKRMYERIIPLAEKLWEQHLKNVAERDDEET